MQILPSLLKPRIFSFATIHQTLNPYPSRRSIPQLPTPATQRPAAQSSVQIFRSSSPEQEPTLSPPRIHPEGGGQKKAIATKQPRQMLPRRKNLNCLSAASFKGFPVYEPLRISFAFCDLPGLSLALAFRPASNPVPPFPLSLFVHTLFCARKKPSLFSKSFA